MNTTAISITLALATCMPPIAAAQTRAIAVGAGAGIARAVRSGVVRGWIVDAAWNPTPRWSLVGEVSSAGDALRDTDFDAEVDRRVISAAVGARWMSRRARRLTPFLHLLTGVARTSVATDTRAGTLGDSSTAVLIQPGGGVAIRAVSTTTIAVQIDHRRIGAAAAAVQAHRHELRLTMAMRTAF